MPTLQEMRTMLERLEFPADKADMLHMLTLMDAPASVLETIRTLPDHRYGSVDTVMDALRGEE